MSLRALSKGYWLCSRCEFIFNNSEIEMDFGTGKREEFRTPRDKTYEEFLP